MSRPEKVSCNQVVDALNATHGNKAQAAMMLGVSQATVSNKLKIIMSGNTPRRGGHLQKGITSDEIVNALDCSSSISEAARKLGVSYMILRVRCTDRDIFEAYNRNIERGNWSKIRVNRPRLVDIQTIVHALNESNTVAAAAKTAGITVAALKSRCVERDIFEAYRANIARNEQARLAKHVDRQKEIGCRLKRIEDIQTLTKQAAKDYNTYRLSLVLNLRRKGLTLENVGTVFGVSRERVRQLEVEALAKLELGELTI